MAETSGKISETGERLGCSPASHHFLATGGRSAMADLDPNLKRCNVCARILTLDSFSKDRSRRDGHAYICKTCCLAYQRRQTAIRGGASRPRGDNDTALTSEQLFWTKVDRGGGPDACWIWRGLSNRTGYGRYSQQVASRVSWVMAHGPIPDGLLVCHHCDNPPCVNPSHLFLGSHLDNLRDSMRKGRTPNRGATIKRALKAEADARMTIVRAKALAQWMHHHPTCARATDAAECSCGLNDAWLALGTSTNDIF